MLLKLGIPIVSAITLNEFSGRCDVCGECYIFPDGMDCNARLIGLGILLRRHRLPRQRPSGMVASNLVSPFRNKMERVADRLVAAN